MAVQKAWKRKWSFLGFSLLFFLISVYCLARVDLLPEARATETISASLIEESPLVAGTSNAVESFVKPEKKESPLSISIPSISLSTKVQNPMTTDIGTLDTALLSGAVRYPTSGLLGQKNANVVIFGHSSYLPIVNNKAFKAFTGIEKLGQGDVITVSSEAMIYTYVVQNVIKADATSDGIPLDVSGEILTLATCNSFGEKSDRFIVTAHLVGSQAISS